MRRHAQVVVHSEVKAPVTHPTQIERLALDGALHHIDELTQNPQLDAVLERVIAQDGVGHERERIVAAVDGKARALGDVQTRHAAAHVAVVGDVVVNERGGLEVLDGGCSADSAVEVTTHGLRRQHANERAMPLLPGVNRYNA